MNDTTPLRRLIVVMGLPGTGKSTLARALADTLHLQHLNTDILRQRLGLQGHYQPEDKNRVYQALLAQAETCLEEEGSVILDGTFALEKDRLALQELALQRGAIIQWVVLDADPALIRRRVSQTRPYTEADFEVYQRVRESWEPLRFPHLPLESTAGNLEENLRSCLAWLAQTPHAD